VIAPAARTRESPFVALSLWTKSRSSATRSPRLRFRVKAVATLWKRSGSGKPQQSAAAMERSPLVERLKRQNGSRSQQLPAP
jgi:hypothetical protein